MLGLTDESAIDPKQEEWLKETIATIKRQGFDKVKAKLEGYETPSRFISSGIDFPIVPDITARFNSEKHYFEIITKTEEVSILVSKCKLLSFMAQQKNGKLHLMVPKGHHAFAKKMMEENGLDAQNIVIKKI